jgi:protein-tyrosine phosphatase
LALIRLEGGCNFRQISGHRAQDGRRVRAGKLYRSGVLSYFSPADQQHLATLRMRTIVDLRSADERRREPALWPDQDVVLLSVEDEAAPASLLRMALKTMPTEASMRRAMIDTYQSMPEALSDRMRLVFECLHREDTPTLIHCAVGKDRTGFAIAMILGALGVSRTIILQDYLYTNEADLERFVIEHHPGLRRPEAGHPLMLLPPAVRQALLGAHPEYLQAALAAVDERYGCVEGYLAQRLGVDAQTLNRIRNHLLE